MQAVDVSMQRALWIDEYAPGQLRTGRCRLSSAADQVTCAPAACQLALHCLALCMCFCDSARMPATRGILLVVISASHAAAEDRASRPTVA
jgi:hypothetical protein